MNTALLPPNILRNFIKNIDEAEDQVLNNLFLAANPGEKENLENLVYEMDICLGTNNILLDISNMLAHLSIDKLPYEVVTKADGTYLVLEIPDLLTQKNPNTIN